MPDAVAAATTELARRALEFSADWQRDGAADELVRMADGWRGPLEAARDALVSRLHRDPGDRGATDALRLVHRALDRARLEVSLQR